MGMYDTINGEQVKCFPWVSLYHDEINYHGGDLAYYDTGCEVPYKKPHYNYGKNFIIFDLNRWISSDYCPYDYVLHVIVDGKVKDTFVDEIGDIDWSINETVVDYYGNLLNIHSDEDILSYRKEQREYWAECEEIRKPWDKLFKEFTQCFSGIGKLDKESEEYKVRSKKFKEIQKLMHEEDDKEQESLTRLSNEFFSKWRVDTSDIDDLINLGNYISAYETEEMAKRNDNAKACKEKIMELLSSDNSLYDRYIEWQGSDEYIKEF